MKPTLFLLGLLAAFTVHAQVFKCADAQGRITYQDAACTPGQEVGTLARDTTPPDLQAVERIRQERKELDAAYEARQARETAERLATAEIALRAAQLAAVEEQVAYPATWAYPILRTRSKPPTVKAPVPPPHRSSIKLFSSRHMRDPGVQRPRARL